MTVRLISVLFTALLIAGAGPAMAAGSSSVSTPSAEPSAYDRAVEAVKAEDYERAIGLLDQVVADDPKNADAWNYLGFSQRNLGQLEPALASYEKALALEPEHRGALEYLGELYLRMDQPDQARAQLEKLDDACFFGCEEYDDLEQAIEAYERQQASG